MDILIFVSPTAADICAVVPASVVYQEYLHVPERLGLLFKRVYAAVEIFFDIVDGDEYCGSEWKIRHSGHPRQVLSRLCSRASLPLRPFDKA